MQRFIPLVLALALVGAACSTAGGSDVASLGDEVSGAVDEAVPETDVDTEAVLLEFAQCMRDNGIPDFEDPVVDADGNPQIFRQATQAGEIDRDTMQTAMDACGEHLERIQLGFERPDESERQDQLLTMAACLREAGFEVDDPDFSGEDGAGGPGRGLFGDLDFEDPETQAALEGCFEEAGITPGGPGGPGGTGTRGPGGPPNA